MIGGSLSLCSGIFVVLAYCGYFTFGEEVEDDILVGYPEIVPVAVVRILLAIAIAWCYPLQLHPTRRCLISLIWKCKDHEISNAKFYLLTYGITLCSFTISMFVDSLGLVLEIIGSLCSPIISFILPGLYYYYLQNQGLLEQEEGKERDYRVKRVFAMFLIVFGCFAIPFGLAVLFVFA